MGMRTVRRVSLLLLLFSGYCVAPISYETARIPSSGLQAQGGLSGYATQGQYQVTACGNSSLSSFSATGVRFGGEVALATKNVQVGIAGGGGPGVYQEPGFDPSPYVLPEGYLTAKVSYPMENSALALKVAWGMPFPYAMMLADLGNPARWTVGLGPILIYSDSTSQEQGGVFWLMRHPEKGRGPVYSLGLAGWKAAGGEWFSSLTVGVGWRLK